MSVKLVSVNFPLVTDQPTRCHALRWSQRRYEHEYGKISFTDWSPDPAALIPGSPVEITMSLQGSSKTFYGYIDYAKHKKTSKSSVTDVYVIGASYLMKQTSQTVYSNMTASAVVERIAKKYGFSYDIAPHKRVYPQISQAGDSDWELMVRLAKQCGYTLRVEGTTLYFKPLSEEFDRYKPFAESFNSATPGNPAPPRLYSINPLIGESISYGDGYKAAPSVAGINTLTGDPYVVVNPSAPRGARNYRRPEFFDRHDVHTSATTMDAAKYEAQAVDELNRFPYRAEAVVIGTPTLHPDAPVYFSDVDDDIDGYWVLINVDHIYKDGMLTSELVAGLDSLSVPEKKQGTSSVAPRPAETAVLQKSVAMKPKTPVTVSKAKNRLSPNPLTTVTAMWKGSGKNLRASGSPISKTLAVLGNK